MSKPKEIIKTAVTVASMLLLNAWVWWMIFQFSKELNENL